MFTLLLPIFRKTFTTVISEIPQRSHLRSLSPRGFSVMPVIAMCSLAPWGSKDAQEPAKSLGAWLLQGDGGVVYPNGSKGFFFVCRRLHGVIKHM